MLSCGSHPRMAWVFAPAIYAGAFADDGERGFYPDNVYTYKGLTSRMSVRDEVYYIETDGPDGERATYRVDYLIGDRDTQWYLTTLGRGRIQVLPVYYDIRQKTWYDPVEGLFDRPEGFKPGQINYWTNFGRNWNFQCFDCHAS